MEKPISREKMIADIDKFCGEFGLSPTDFGIQALNDSAFYGRLVSGKSPTLDRIERVYEFMQSAGGAHDLLG